MQTSGKAAQINDGRLVLTGRPILEPWFSFLTQVSILVGLVPSYYEAL